MATPSITRGSSCQEGGTEGKQEVQRSMRPLQREPTRGVSGGGVRKSAGKTKQMALAMEWWLVKGKSQDPKDSKERKERNTSVKEKE